MSSDQPLVTMAVSGFNQERFILDTLRSIDAQTYPNVEVVMVDGGGSDRMGEVAQEFLAAGRFPWRFHRQGSNLGMVKDRHKAFEMARGEYVCFLDSDDVAFPNRVAKQLRHIQENDCDAAYGNMSRLYPDGMRAMNRGAPVQAAKDWAPEVFVERLVRHKGPMAQAGLFRRSLLAEVGGIDQGFHMNDWPFMIEAARRARRMMVVRDPVFYYRMHPTSHHAKHLAESMSWRVDVIRHYCAPPLARQAIARCYRAVADEQLKQGQGRQALRWMAKAAVRARQPNLARFTRQAIAAGLRQRPGGASDGKPAKETKP